MFRLILLFLCLCQVAVAAPPPTADVLLKEADRARGSAEGGLTWRIDVRTVEDKRTREQAYLVRVKGENARIEALEPEKQRGEVVLARGRSLWYVKPGLKKPITVSARQKLTGQAVHGDIAATDFSGDYDGRLDGEETLEGVPTWRLELKAKTNGVTYDRVRYWVSKDRKLGLRAEFLTRDGKVFKRAVYEYGNTLKTGGKEAPFLSRMTITDPAFPDRLTIVQYGAPKAEAHADALFAVESLVK